MYLHSADKVYSRVRQGYQPKVFSNIFDESAILFIFFYHRYFTLSDNSVILARIGFHFLMNILKNHLSFAIFSG